MTTQQDSVDVERLREALEPSGATKAAYHGEFSFDVFEGVSDEGGDMYRKVYVPWDTVKEIMSAIRARAALTLPITQRDEQGDQARQEAIMLLDEVNKQAKSRAFYGIHQTLHAKLCTIRMTLARPDWQAPATAIRRLSIEQGDQDGGTPA